MKFTVNITDKAQEDVAKIYLYIKGQLQAPMTAKKQVARILDEINKLETLPFKFPLCDKERWQKRGLHSFSVDNYIVFYYINEEKNTVIVLRVFYKKRDLEKLI